MQQDGGRTITKKELAERIADATNDSRACVRRVLQSLLDEIVNELASGNRIEFRDFGVFETKTRAARVAQNPRTLERVEVPERRNVKFKPGRKMREAIESSESPVEAVITEPKLGATPNTSEIGDHVAARR